MSINGVTCTSDILGNRLTTGGTSMTWDCLNRMTSLTNTLGTESCAYRADGMRVSKANGANGTTYRYDGQMAMEDVDTGSNPAVTDYAIGARGIDAISKTVGSNTVVVYPIYDAHGNMMADVSRNGSSFSINDKRSYDAWGNIRSGATSGDSKGRYCANLGHVEDDESNLIYMRARYYDPTSGRFLSEDPDQKGGNWYAYCDNQPLTQADYSGKDSFNLDDIMNAIDAIAKQFGIQLPKWFKPSGELIGYICLGMKFLAQADAWLETGYASSDLAGALFAFSPGLSGICLVGGCAAGIIAMAYGTVAVIEFEQAADELELLVDSE